MVHRYIPPYWVDQRQQRYLIGANRETPMMVVMQLPIFSCHMLSANILVLILGHTVALIRPPLYFLFEF